MQVEPTECGAACLSMILRHFGQYVSLEQLRIETDVTRDGCSAGNIVRAAQRRGLRCEGFRRDADELAQMRPPCILWWEHNHFVVYEGMRNGECCINDPAYGKRSIPMQKLESSFSGIVLSFEPEPEFSDFPEYGKKPETYLRSGRIREMFASHRRHAVTAVAAGLLGQVAVLAAILYFALAASPGVGGEGAAALLLPGAFLLVFILSMIIGERSLRRLKDSVELRNSWTYLHRLFDMPLTFLQQRDPETLTERIRRNDRVGRYTGETVTRGIIAAGGILLCLILPVIMAFSKPSALLLLLPLVLLIPAVFAVRLLMDRQMTRVRTRVNVQDAELAAAVLSGAGRIDTVHSLGLDQEYADKALELSRNSAGMHQQLAGEERREKTLRFGLYGLAVAAFMLLLRGTHMADDGTLLLWLLLFAVLIPALETLLNAASGLQEIDDEIQAASDIVAENREENTQGKAQPAAQKFRRLQGNIRCHGTAFAYGAFGERIVDDLNLYLPVGSSLAVTGPSGSGKSTVGKLLAGLLEPTDGEILYDNRPAGEIPRQVICASIAMVRQKSELFAGSIRDNITLWNPNITSEDLARAIADACVEDCVLGLPDGVDTQLGDRGRGLSGGEQQRVEIARALATDPSILILDEAFTAIDDATTEQIMANIRRRGCTCVIAGHDQLLIGGCSQRLDLEKGGDRP